MSDSDFYDAGYNDGINDREVNDDYADNDYYAAGYEDGTAQYQERFA